MALITSANAREMAAKGNAAIKARIQRLRDAVTDPAPVIEQADSYTAKILARTRVQLDLVNSRLTEQLDKSAVDAQAIDRLAAAQSRLAEQERILAGRPLPGSRKPAQERAPRHQPVAPEPIPTPHPVVNSVPSASVPQTAGIQPVQDSQP